MPSISSSDVEALIAHFAALTDPQLPGRGVNRLAYTELERKAHAHFSDYMRNLGLEVSTDAVGNTIAELPGSTPLPALATGSHLDSVLQAGRFDGVAGVVAAMLAAREAVKLTRRRPWRFVVFANEEGARFGLACIGSRFAAGALSAESAATLRDAQGISLPEAMKSVGFNPDNAPAARWNPQDYAAFIELHVEQGPELAAREIPIGIVERISGSHRMLFTFTGIASHSGGTPMDLRADALVAAARTITTATDSITHPTRVTFGKISVEPGSITTIPGVCALYGDIRDDDSDRLRAATRQVTKLAEAAAQAQNVEVSVEKLAATEPAVLDPLVPEAIDTASRRLGLRTQRMSSGASHDTQLISSLCAAGMIFVPSLNGGVSHCPEEFTDYAQLAQGAELLVTTLGVLDEF